MRSTVQKSNRVFRIEHLEPDLNRTFIPQDQNIHFNYLEYGMIIANNVVQGQYTKCGLLIACNDTVLLQYNLVKKTESEYDSSTHSEMMPLKSFLEKTKVFGKDDDITYKKDIVALLDDIL
jgi:hypothetical protein